MKEGRGKGEYQEPFCEQYSSPFHREGTGLSERVSHLLGPAVEGDPTLSSGTGDTSPKPPEREGKREKKRLGKETKLDVIQ